MSNYNNYSAGNYEYPTKAAQVKNPLISNALTSQSQLKKSFIEITQDDQDYLTYFKNKFILRKQAYIASNKDWKFKQPTDLRKQVYNLLEQLLQQNNTMKKQLDIIYQINYGQQTYWTFYDALCQYFRQLRQCNFKTANSIIQSTKLSDLPNLVSEFNMLSDKLQQFQQSKLKKVQTQNSSFYEKLLNSIDNHQVLNSHLLSSPQSKNLTPFIKQKLTKQIQKLKSQKKQSQQNNSYRWLKFFLSIIATDFDQKKVQFMLQAASQQIPASKQLTQTLKGIERFCESKRKFYQQNNKDSKISIKSNKSIQSQKSSQQKSEFNLNHLQFYQKINNVKDYVTNQFQFIRNKSIARISNNNTYVQIKQQKLKQLCQKIIQKVNKDFQFNQNLFIKQPSNKQSEIADKKFARHQQKSSHTVQNTKLKLFQQGQKLKSNKSSAQIQNDQQLNNQFVKVLQSKMTVLQLKNKFQATLKNYQNACNELRSQESYRSTNLLQIENKNKQIQLLKKKQQQFNTEILNKNKLIQSLQKKQSNQKQIKRYQQLNPALNEKIKILQEQLKRNISSISNLKYEKRILQGEINKLRNELKEQRNKSIKYQESPKSQDALKQQIVNLRKDLELLEDVKATAQAELNRKDQLIHEKNAEITKMQSQIVNLKAQIIKINNLNQQKLNQFLSLKSQLQINKSIISEHEKDKHNQNLINQSLNNKIHELEAEIQKLKSQKKTPQFRSFNLNTNQKRQTTTSVGKTNPVTKNIELRSTTKVQTNLKSGKIENQKYFLIEENKKTIQINAQTQSEVMKKRQLQLFSQLNTLIVSEQKQKNLKLLYPQNIITQISQKETQTQYKKIDENQIQGQNDLSNVTIQGKGQFQQLKDQQLDNCKKCQQYEKEIDQLTKSNQNLRNKNRNLFQYNSELQQEKNQKQQNEKQLQQTKLQLQNTKILLKNNQSNEREDSLANQKIKKEVQQKCAIILQLEENIKELSNKVSELENDKITLQKTIENLKIQHQETVKKYEQKDKTKTETNQTKPKQQNATTQQLEALKKEFKMKVLTLELDLQEKSEHYDELYRKYKKQTTGLTNKIQTLTSATPGLQTEITTLKRELNKKQQTLNNLSNQIAELQKFIIKQKNDSNKFDQQVKELKKQNQSAQKQLSRLNKERDTFESESYILKDKMRNQKNLNKQEIEKLKKDQAKEIKDLRLQNAHKLQEARRQIKSIQFAQKFKTITDTNNESNAYMRLEFQKTKKDLQMELSKTKRLESEIKQMNNQIIQLKKILQEKDKQIKKSERKWQTMKQLMMLQI